MFNYELISEFFFLLLCSVCFYLGWKIIFDSLRYTTAWDKRDRRRRMKQTSVLSVSQQFSVFLWLFLFSFHYLVLGNRLAFYILSPPSFYLSLLALSSLPQFIYNLFIFRHIY